MAADVFDNNSGGHGSVMSSSSLFLLLLVVLPTVLAGQKPTLFSSSDDVVLLDSTNFDRLVHGSNTFWMIDFYNSWCGHCIRFAPVWKELATDVKNWRSVVRIGAVDCSDDANVKLCREKKVTHYPTVMYFPPNTSPDYVGNLFQKSRVLNVLRYSLVEFITQEQFMNLSQLERLKPLKSLESIWWQANTDIKYSVVLFLSKRAVFAQELILDMLPYRNISLRYMLKEDATGLGIEVFPSLYLMAKEGGFVKLASNITERKELLDVLKKYFGLTTPASNNDNQKNDVNKTLLEEGTGQDKGHSIQSTAAYQQVPEAVYYDDLISALTYSLTHEVASMKTIDGETLEALRQYIEVLVKYLPASENVISYLGKVNKWLSDVSTSLEGSQWLKQLHDLQDSTSYIPFNATYVGCRGSEPRYRGYPCSMWVLFHTLTVNSVIEHGTDANFNPQEVLLAMRGYISHFFGCRECSVNFNKGARFIEEKVQKADDGILYLWIMHNRANYRLHGDITEDPRHPKIQFPGRDLCSDCQLGETSTDGKPSWNETRVLEFLKAFYSSRNIRSKPAPQDDGHKVLRSDTNAGALDIDDVARKLSEIDVWRANDARRREDVGRLSDIKAASWLGRTAQRYDSERMDRLRRYERDTRLEVAGMVGARSAANLTRLDLSLCVVFYVISTGFILVAYFYFVIRRKMKISACCNELV